MMEVAGKQAGDRESHAGPAQQHRPTQITAEGEETLQERKPTKTEKSINHPLHNPNNQGPSRPLVQTPNGNLRHLHETVKQRLGRCAQAQ
jgi:hypothetical protein